MHELSIAYNLVEIAEQAARAEGAASVRTVYLRLGAMAGVVEGALRFCFPVAAKGTLVEGARLVVETVPVQIYCEHCRETRMLEAPFVFRCPACGEIAVRLVEGREIQIESIEIEECSEEIDDKTTHSGVAPGRPRQE